MIVPTKKAGRPCRGTIPAYLVKTPVEQSQADGLGRLDMMMV